MKIRRVLEGTVPPRSSGYIEYSAQSYKGQAFTSDDMVRLRDRVGAKSVNPAGSMIYSIRFSLDRHHRAGSTMDDIANAMNELHPGSFLVYREFVEIAVVSIDDDLHYQLEIPRGSTRDMVIDIAFNKIRSFSGMAKNLRAAENSIVATVGDPRPLIETRPIRVLGLVACKAIRHLVKMDTDPAWVDILAKHVRTHDVLACQEELIDSGLEEFAEL